MQNLTRVCITAFLSHMSAHTVSNNNDFHVLKSITDCTADKPFEHFIPAAVKANSFPSDIYSGLSDSDTDFGGCQAI